MEENNQELEFGQKEFEEIEKYVLGELEPERLLAFEARLANDEKFSAQVKEQTILIQASREAPIRELLDTFHEDLGERDASVIPLKTSPLQKYLIAASLAIIVIGSVWLMLIKEKNSEQIFAEFYQVDPGLATRMSDEGPYTFNRGMVDYKSDNYQDAIKIWEPLHRNNLDNDTLNYFLGSAFLADRQAEKAIFFLSKVKLQEKSAFYAESLWYLSLAYILQEDYPKAAALLEKSSHPDKENLLNHLKNNP